MKENEKNLRILRASNIGLTDLADLNELTQITSLDLSDNDLSKLTEKNRNYLQISLIWKN